METLNYFTFLLLPFLGGRIRVSKGRIDRGYNIKLEAHWKLQPQFAQTWSWGWGWGHNNNNNQAEFIISCSSLNYQSSRQRQNLQPDTTALLCSSAVFCQTPGSRGGAAAAWSGPMTDVLQASECPHCAGSLVSWEAMSLFFKIVSESLAGCSCSSELCNVKSPCNFYLHVFLSLN